MSHELRGDLSSRMQGFIRAHARPFDKMLDIGMSSSCSDNLTPFEDPDDSQHKCHKCNQPFKMSWLLSATGTAWRSMY